MKHAREDTAVGQFELDARRTFQASVDRLDGATRSRLNQARQRAVAHAGRPTFRFPRLWLPAGAFATAAAVAVAVFLVLPVAPHHDLDSTAVEEVDLLSANEGLGLYAEEPEFYEWAGAGEAGAAPAALPDRG